VRVARVAGIDHGDIGFVVLEAFERGGPLTRPKRSPKRASAVWARTGRSEPDTIT